MNSFENQFSFLAIVRVLATFRAKEANLRHRKVFYWRYFGGEEDPSKLSISGANELLPPRRQWARPNRMGRGGHGRPVAQILRDAIYRKVQGVVRAGRLDEFEWGRRLRSFVEDVQARVRDGGIKFDRPRLWLRPKAMPIAGKTKCRCISCYENLSDRVILALANKWLSNTIDSSFLDCCYSFRGTRKITYNTAIQNLVTYRKEHTGLIYAANCDVMKFFDTVNHDIVRELVGRRIADVEGSSVFLRLLDGYLSSYNLAWMLGECRRISIKSSYFPDVVDVEIVSHMYDDGKVDLAHLGLPQGGALSGTLANIVLDVVDRAVMSTSLTDLFYARYCDDILIAHGEKSDCEKALGIIKTALQQIKVPVHPFETKFAYNAGYYEAKSKGPYAWTRSRDEARYSAPCVSFLGCCVRYDGELRIRDETINGHAQSMREECASFLKRVRCAFLAKSRISKLQDRQVDEAVKGLMYRLVDKGVGRVTGTMGRGIGRCWLAAFPTVWASSAAKSQLRVLDRIRTDLFAMVKRKLKLSLKKKGTESDDGPSLYFGKPFSYAGISERLVRAHVVRMRKLSFEECQEDDDGDYDEVDYEEELPEFDPASDWGRASGR